MEQQYIEAKKVLGVEECSIKTPAGNDIVKVLFDDSTFEVMPKSRFELIVSEEPNDPSAIQRQIKARVASICFATLHEYGVKMGEVNGIIDAVTALVNDGFTKAQDLMWGFDYLSIPLIDVDKILKDNYEKQSINGPASTGSGSNQ